MKKQAASMPAGLDRSGLLTQDNQAYLEFQLDHSTFKAVESLARRSGCTNFEMCVRLVAGNLTQAARPTSSPA